MLPSGYNLVRHTILLPPMATWTPIPINGDVEAVLVATTNVTATSSALSRTACLAAKALGAKVNGTKHDPRRPGFPSRRSAVERCLQPWSVVLMLLFAAERHTSMRSLPARRTQRPIHRLLALPFRYLDPLGLPAPFRPSLEQPLGFFPSSSFDPVDTAGWQDQRASPSGLTSHGSGSQFLMLRALSLVGNSPANCPMFSVSTGAVSRGRTGPITAGSLSPLLGFCPCGCFLCGS